MRGLYLLIFLFLGCSNESQKNLSHHILKATINSCNEKKCIYFNHIGGPKEVLNNNKRQHLVVSSKTKNITKSDILQKINLPECKIIGEMDIVLDQSKLKSLLGKRNVSIINTDTISYMSGFLKKIENEGKTGIIIFKSPLQIQCKDNAFIASGIEWKRSETFFLFEIQSDSLKLVSIY